MENLPNKWYIFFPNFNPKKVKKELKRANDKGAKRVNFSRATPTVKLSILTARLKSKISEKDVNIDIFLSSFNSNKSIIPK